MSYIGMKLPLKEGESYCTNCDGTGRVVSGDRCQKCLGTGKLDWVEKVVGKKRDLFSLLTPLQMKQVDTLPDEVVDEVVVFCMDDKRFYYGRLGQWNQLTVGDFK